MKGKLKKAVRESFSFPETAHKDEFFRQVDGSPVIQKKPRSNIPVFVRFTAVAAAAAFCFGVWRNLDLDPVLYKDNSIIETTSENDSLSATETTAASALQNESVTITTPADSINAAETTSEAPQNSLVGIDDPDSSAVTPTAPVTTDIPVSPDTPVIHDERSMYMKKFAAFTSAVIVLAANSPLNAFAEYQPPEIGPDVQAVINYIDNTTPDLDFNCDGAFNACDLYVFNRYTSARLTATDDVMVRCAENGDVNKDGVIDFEDWRAIDRYADSIGDAADTELDFNGDGNYFVFDNYVLLNYVCITTLYSDEELAKILVNGDVNCDGIVNTDDARSLIDYYVLKNDVTSEELEESHYEIKGIPDTDWAWNFVYFLRCAISDYDMGYRNITQMVQNGETSLDFNADGTTNILDAFDYYYYCSVKDGISDYDAYLLRSTPLISRETWENCAYFDSIRPDGYGIVGAGVNRDHYAVTKYFLYNSELTGEMLESDMYSAHREEGSGSFALYLKDLAENEGIIAADGTTINDALFWSYYDKCEAQFNSGERSLPDVDLNGVVDYEDYFVANIFFNDHFTGVSCEDSILPADVWNHFNKNCDFNENGISGDVYDTTIVNIYVIKHAEEEPADFDDAYLAYIAELKSAKGISDDSDQADLWFGNEITINWNSPQALLASITDDESDVTDVTPKPTEPGDDSHVEAKLYGDADCSGKVDILDVIVLNRNLLGGGELTAQGKANVDVNRNNMPDTDDALNILKFTVELIDQLPL